MRRVRRQVPPNLEPNLPLPVLHGVMGSIGIDLISIMPRPARAHRGQFSTNLTMTNVAIDVVQIADWHHLEF